MLIGFRRNIILKYAGFIINLMVALYIGQFSGMIGLAGLGLVIGIWFRYLQKAPALAFMFSFTLYLNIGLFLSDYSFGLPAYLKFRYVFLLLSLLVLFSPKLRNIRYDSYKVMRNLLLIIIFLNMYQILLNIIIQLGLDVIPTIRQVYKFFPQIFGIYILFPTFCIVIYNAKEVVNVIILISGFFLGIFFFQYITGIEIMQVEVDYRIFGTGLKRVYFQSSGFIPLLIYFSMILFSLRYKSQLRWFLFASAIAYFMTIVLSLTRSTMISFIGGIFVAIIILQKYFRVALSRYTAWMLYAGAIVFIGAIVFTELFSNLFVNFQMSWYELTGQVAEGTTQSRSTYELLNVMPIIKDNFFFGVGYQKFWYNAGKFGDYGLSDIPLFANIGIYGIVGISTFLYLFYAVIKQFFVFLKKVKQYTQPIIAGFGYEIMLAFGAGLTLLSYLLFSLVNFTSYLSTETGMVYFGFMIGIIYGINRKLEVWAK